MDLEDSWPVEMNFQLGLERLQQEGERGIHVGLQDQCLGVHEHGP